MAGETKVVVTNWRALRSKYGRQLKKIEEALGALVEADRRRGIDTRVVHLDDRTEMEEYEARPVGRVDSPLQAKHAIDDVFRHFKPSYLMILGASDVVRHQSLKSHLYSSQDSNRTVYSDLPYACEADYSTEIDRFTGPTRSVGRLPDVTGRSGAGYLAGLLRSAVRSEPLAAPAPDGGSCLGISAKAWEESTRRNLDEIFAHKRKYSLGLSPSEGPDWNSSLLARPIHFINCHGGKIDCRFYGDERSGGVDAGDLIAHDSGCVAGRLTQGTVAVVECCYGARLFNPADATSVLGICNTYLASGARAYFGSSTVAYGGDRTVEYADALCQYFLLHLLEGQTSGDAALAARLDFVRGNDLDPIAYKTLAQFSLMGDPSLQPFLKAGGKTGPTPVEDEGHVLDLAHRGAQRAAYRASLAERGAELQKVRAVSHHPISIPDAPATIRKILDLADVTGWDDPQLESFMTSAPDSPPDESAALVHVVSRPPKETPLPFEDIELIVATEAGGDIVSWRHVFSR
jgi:hypothetical protein